MSYYIDALIALHEALGHGLAVDLEGRTTDQAYAALLAEVREHRALIEAMRSPAVVAASDDYLRDAVERRKAALSAANMIATSERGNFQGMPAPPAGLARVLELANEIDAWLAGTRAHPASGPTLETVAIESPAGTAWRTRDSAIACVRAVLAAKDPSRDGYFLGETIVDALLDVPPDRG